MEEEEAGGGGTKREGKEKRRKAEGGDKEGGRQTEIKEEKTKNRKQRKSITVHVLLLRELVNKMFYWVVSHQLYTQNPKYPKKTNGRC